MKFWKVIFSLFMWITIPYKVKKFKYKNNDLVLIHVYIMPWAVGMTIGNWIFTTYKPKDMDKPKRKAFIHHEFIHYKQWVKLGWKFIPSYIWASIVGLVKEGKPYEGNKYEIEAHRAEAAFRKNRGLVYYTKWID